MNRENELEWLYREIARMGVAAGFIPDIRLPGMPGPIDHAGSWARNNPDTAYRLVVDIRNKLVQALP